MRRLFIALLLGLPAAALVLPAAAAPTSPLLEAASTDDRAAALQSLANGADARAKLDDGTTALHYAAHFGNLDLAQRLIKAGADARARNDYGSTPMQEAAERGDPALIRLLLKAGADANTANDEGETALMTVARTGSVEAAKALIKAHANVNAVEQWRGQTALMWAAAQGNPEMVRLLIKSGAKVDTISTIRDWDRKVTAEPRPQNRPPGGFTALLLAAREGCAPCAQELVKARADINLTNPENITPLLMAILNARFDTARALIEAGADVNRWDVWGRAPLYSAIDYNTTPRGGRPDRPSSDQTLPLEVAQMLLDRGANPTTPLMAAAGVGWATVDIRGRFRNEPPCIETAGLLLDAGANINSVNANGQSALHGAAQLGWTQVVRYLGGRGAKLDVKDGRGATPLDIAMGRAGGTGRAGVAGAETHPETAAALRELLAGSPKPAARTP